MSRNTSSKPSSHGFSSAIFASSPVYVNKENELPDNQAGSQTSRDRPVIPIDSPMQRKNEIQAKCPLNNARGKTNVRNEANAVRSKSASSASSASRRRRESQEKSAILGRSTSPSGLSTDKPPTTYFFTPKQIKSGATGMHSNRKIGLSSASKTLGRRYFVDDKLPPSVVANCCSNVEAHVETPSAKPPSMDLGEEQISCEGESSNLTVGIRVRPLNSNESSEPQVVSIVEANGSNIIVDGETARHTFLYDHCFMSRSDPQTAGHVDQETLFNSMVLPLTVNAFQGYNVCLFAYGQTGSGKSYSMMGIESTEATSCAELSADAGIIPRFCQEIFARSSENVEITTTVEISYFEIYNEKIHDLLASNNGGGVKRAPLKVREHPVFGPYVVDLSQHSVRNYKDLQTWLKVGNSQRATAATGMNEKSSRSHSIFSIVMTQTNVQKAQDGKSADASRRSKINLVDLAGSERLSNTCASGDRLREGVSINKSLLILGKVIASLAESGNNRKRGFVPYRESVLTWLLKESLGGNSRTAMLATVSPANIHLEETLATLRYACQARAIVNRIRINEDPHDRLIRELKAEVLRLRGVREGYEKQLTGCPRRLFDCPDSVRQSQEQVQEKQGEIDRLKYQLKKTEEQLAATEMSWLEKLREAEERKNSELKHLRRCGIAVEIDFREKNQHPCLVNLAADPMLSGTLFYLIPPGVVRVGKNTTTRSGSPSKKVDILLDGPLVRQLHCTIENRDGKLTLSPETNGGDTYVNGQMVIGKVYLKHGDRLVIGGNHYFKVSNPSDERTIQVSTQPIDFEFAYQEILRIQEEKLRAELEESKQRAIEELENAKRQVEMQLGSQKSTYERKIEDLGFSLEEQKLAFEEINRKKKELELEKQLLVGQVEMNNRIRKMQLEGSQTIVPPYQSNFLQELESILTEKTVDVEAALKMKISADAINAGGVSLHEMQLLVREATERCRELGIPYEFHQQRLVENRSLQPIIRVRDTENMVETLWQQMRFLRWVHKLRDYDMEEDSMGELRNSDDTWESYEDSQVFQDSANTSRISINMTPVKKRLNESLQQLSSFDASLFETSLASQTSETLLQRDNVKACITQMEVAARTLYKLCKDRENGQLVGGDNRTSTTTTTTTTTVVETLLKIQALVSDLQNTLGNRSDSKREDESGSSARSDVTVIEKIQPSKYRENTTAQSPFNSNTNADFHPGHDSMSNLRHNGNCFLKDGSPQKTVRFVEKHTKHPS